MASQTADPVAVPADRLSDFWRGIYPDGIPLSKVLDELHDLEFLADEIPKVYCHVSGGRISKPNTHGSAVIGEHDRQRQEDIEEALKEGHEELASCLEYKDGDPERVQVIAGQTEYFWGILYQIKKGAT